MLYGTTRANADIFTANHALTQDASPSGGQFVPYKMPSFSHDALQALARLSFSERIGEILNMLFGKRLSGIDIEYAIGRRPVRFVPLHHKAISVQCWHNLGSSKEWLVARLAALLTEGSSHVCSWTVIACNAAILFAVFGELPNLYESPVDLVFTDEESDELMAAWYAREWGLPIGNIVLSCAENSSMWQFLHRGMLRTEDANLTVSERLLFACGGAREVQRFLDVYACSGVYCPTDRTMAQLRKGIAVTVISRERLSEQMVHCGNTRADETNIITVQKISSLMDYRAVSGESRPALIFSARCATKSD